MEQESRVLEVLRRIGISCGAYTIPVAEIVGEQGKVYAPDKDKEALDALIQRCI